MNDEGGAVGSLHPSSLILHPFFGAVAKWLRRRSAKPLFSGSNPLGASSPTQSRSRPEADRSRSRRGGEIGRHRGLKIPRGQKPRAGSSPAPGTQGPRFSGCLSQCLTHSMTKVTGCAFLHIPATPIPSLTPLVFPPPKQGEKSGGRNRANFDLGFLAFWLFEFGAFSSVG